MFTASGKTIEFAGFRRAYVEGSDDPLAELEDQETLLPAAREGDRVHGAGVSDRGLQLLGVDPKRHETLPPPRFTEAALIKELESEGIGRPSTYASIIATIERREYVFRQGKALVPSFTAFAVTELLRRHFADYVDVGFTAEMEEALDAISNGEQSWLEFIRGFYRGDGKHAGLEGTVGAAKDIDYPVTDLGTDPETGAAGTRAHRAVRPVRAARRGRRRKHRVDSGRFPARRSHDRACPRTAEGEGGGPARARGGPEDRAACLCAARPLRCLRAARGDAGQGGQVGGEAETRVADRRHDAIRP